jgi:hypothetical protein
VFIAGISGTTVTGADVAVSSSGQLGVASSSARFKRDIHDMGKASSGLMKLRPVTFRYKSDPQGVIQYGLVAEEVERVYPELVAYGADGKVETVRYSVLTSRLLNELQKQAREAQEQITKNQRLASQVSGLSAQMVAMRLSEGREVADLKANYERDLGSIQQRLAAMEQAMQTRDGAGKLAAATPLERLQQANY